MTGLLAKLGSKCRTYTTSTPSSPSKGCPSLPLPAFMMKGTPDLRSVAALVTESITSKWDLGFLEYGVTKKLDDR